MTFSSDLDPRGPGTRGIRCRAGARRQARHPRRHPYPDHGVLRRGDACRHACVPVAARLDPVRLPARPLGGGVRPDRTQGRPLDGDRDGLPGGDFTSAWDAPARASPPDPGRHRVVGRARGPLRRESRRPVLKGSPARIGPGRHREVDADPPPWPTDGPPMLDPGLPVRPSGPSLKSGARGARLNHRPAGGGGEYPDRKHLEVMMKTSFWRVVAPLLGLGASRGSAPPARPRAS